MPASRQATGADCPFRCPLTRSPIRKVGVAAVSERAPQLRPCLHCRHRRCGIGPSNSILLDGCSLFMEVYMAKRKRRAWTKKDIAELKAHSKSRTPVSKISKVMKRTVGALRRKAGIVGIRLGPVSYTHL